MLNGRVFCYDSAERKGKQEGKEKMLKRFYPDLYLTSAYQIEYEKLYEEGYRGIIFDIDNTLVEHGAPADERSMELIARLKKIGYRIFLLSNNKEPRVKLFNDAVQVSYIYKAGKPGVKGYQKAMERMGTDASTTLFVGDQLFTDVWGAKKAGIFTCLTQPIDPREEIQIVLKRYLEKIVLFFYRQDCIRNGKQFLMGGSK